MNNYGAKDLQTPNMDRLAKEGTKFTQFYAASPVCSPSRAALLTGKSPDKCGMVSNSSSQKGGKEGLPSKETTIAEYLKEKGYVTSLIGKWHLGYADGMTPNDQGFDYQFGHMGGCIDNYSHFFYWSGPNVHDLYRNNKEVWYDGEFFPDLMEKEAAQFIQENQDTSFFMYYAFNMPHYPLQGSEKWRAVYKDLPSPRKEYATFLSTLDEKIGTLLDQLDDLGIRENTMVILQSDHGHSTELRTLGGGGNAGPYRGAKFSLFEGGVRVPAIISFPGTIPKGQVRTQLSANIDWFATITDYLFDEEPKQIEGQSLKEVIQYDDASPYDSFVWKWMDWWAVRKGNWKLLYKPLDPLLYEGEPWRSLPPKDSLFLVNLSEDIGEKTNLSNQYPERVKELREIYEAWLKE
jgi:arylsulfatase A-like enzyme